jgi:hypothetical protein
MAIVATVADASDLPPAKVEFQALVNRTIAIGMQVDAAVNRLEGLGLKCKRVEKGWTNKVDDRTSFIFCSRQEGALVLTRWQVAILPQASKVADLLSNVGLIGP